MGSNRNLGGAGLKKGSFRYTYCVFLQKRYFGSDCRPLKSFKWRALFLYLSTYLLLPVHISIDLSIYLPSLTLTIQTNTLHQLAFILQIISSIRLPSRGSTLAGKQVACHFDRRPLADSETL